MTSAKAPASFRGGCHCGAVGVEFSSALDPTAIVPRACDCSFCRKHGAAYVSDPHGQLRISTGGASTLRSYRQGSGTARFHLCGECGVLVAVTYEHAGRLHGAVNVSCLDGRTGFAAPLAASPQSLGAEEKIARWLQLWVPDVQLVASGD